MSNHALSKRGFFFGVCLAAIASSGANAQETDAGAQQPGSPAPQANRESDGEIVVTAQRREQALSDVPLTITAFGANELEQSRILAPQDLMTHVTGLDYRLVSGAAKIYLRGLGNTISAPNADQTIATYVDDVYIANNTAATQQLLALDRIEVLKGPQSILFGRNAVGGAISFITRSPGNTLAANLTAGIGNFDAVDVSGYLESPLGDDLAIGVYGLFSRRDNYFNVTSPPVQGEARTYSSAAGRLRLVYRPTTNFKITGSIQYVHTVDPEISPYRQIQDNAVPYVTYGAPRVPGIRNLSRDFSDTSRSGGTAATLRAELNLDHVSLVSITGYRDFRTHPLIDYDSTTTPLTAFGSRDRNQQNIHSEQFSQEVQALSNGSDEQISWIAGAIFFYENASQFLPINIEAQLGPSSPYSDINGRVNTNSYAAYAQVTFPLSMLAPGLRLTAGARYTVDVKDMVDSFTIRGDQFNNLIESTRRTFPDLNESWDNFSPRVSLEYHAGPTLLYGSISRGYRSGVFNLTSPTAPGPINPETITAYEVGTHSSLLNGRVRLDGALFYYDFKNLQVQVVTQGASPAAATLQNAAAARVYGAEFGIDARISRRFSVNAGISYNHSRYVDFTNYQSFVRAAAGNTPVVVDVTGNPLERAAKWTITGGADYTVPIGAANLTFAADWYHNSGFAWDAFGLGHQPAYDLVNSSVAMETADRAWRVSAWVRNLFQEDYLNARVVNATGTVVIDSFPRTFGMTVSRTW